METCAKSDRALARPFHGPRYQVDELLAMRNLATYSTACLERLMEEDCLKHLVLKSVAMMNGMTGKHEAERSGNSSGSSILNGAGPKEHTYDAAGNKKPSPSPSIKRGKAERLLKEHGSPPGMRVTAGGRIVPTDFDPLGTPQMYGSKGKLTFHRESEPSIPHGFIGYDQKGQLCQKVGNSLLPVKIINGVPQFYTPPANSFSALPAPTDITHQQSAHSLFSGFPIGSMPMMAPGFSVLGGGPPFGPAIMESTLNNDAQIQFLENEYLRLDKERQEFERYEVLKKESLPPSGREELVNRKRKYVLDLDQIRKSIKNLKAIPITGISTNHLQYGGGNGNSQFGNSAPSVMPPFPLYSQPLGIYGAAGPRFFPNAGFPSAVDSTMAPYPQFSILSGDGNAGLQLPEPEAKPAPAPRRSHAVEITNPASRTKSRRGLDPTSPDYIPGKPVRGTGVPVMTSPSNPPPSHMKNKASNSSVTTSAFFPVNTHEHSTVKPVSSSEQKANSTHSCGDTDDVTAAAPSTPPKSQTQSSDQSPNSHAIITANAEVGRDAGVSVWKHSSNLSSDQRSAFSEIPPLHASVKSSFSGESSDVRKSGIGPLENVPPGTESFLDGYCDGLARKAPSHYDKSTDYLNGYCQGLHRYQTRPENDLRWSSEDSKFKPLGPSPISMNSAATPSVAESVGRAQGHMLPEAVRHETEEHLASDLASHLPLDGQKQSMMMMMDRHVQSVKSPLSAKGVRQYIGNTIYGAQPFTIARPSVSTGPIYSQRGWPSGCDGVMDEISDSVADASPSGVEMKDRERVDVIDTKMGNRTSGMVDNGEGSSPKKTSPAKTKLEQIAHRVRRKDGNTGDGLKGTSEDRRRRWRIRFEKIKKMDQEEIRQYQKDHPLPPSS